MPTAVHIPTGRALFETTCWEIFSNMKAFVMPPIAKRMANTT
jgi:hypothetical protein